MEHTKAIVSDIEKQMKILGELSRGVKYDDLRIHFDQVYNDPQGNGFDFVLGLLCGTIIRGADGQAVLTDLTLNAQKHFAV